MMLYCYCIEIYWIYFCIGELKNDRILGLKFILYIYICMKELHVTVCKIYIIKNSVLRQIMLKHM